MGAAALPEPSAASNGLMFSGASVLWGENRLSRSGTMACLSNFGRVGSGTGASRLILSVGRDFSISDRKRSSSSFSVAISNDCIGVSTASAFSMRLSCPDSTVKMVAQRLHFTLKAVCRSGPVNLNLVPQCRHCIIIKSLSGNMAFFNLLRMRASLSISFPATFSVRL